MMYMLPYSRMNTNSLLDLFDDFERSVLGASGHRFPSFRTDIRDEGDHYLLQAELPGFQKDDIEVDVKENVLTISAQIQQCSEQTKDTYLCRERRSGSFSRSFRLEGIQQENISAAYTNGILELKLPKQQEILPQSRKIAIQ